MSVSLELQLKLVRDEEERQAELREALDSAVRKMDVNLKSSSDWKVFATRTLEGKIEVSFEDSTGVQLLDVKDMLHGRDALLVQSAPAANPQPPVNAEFILHLLLRKDEQDALIGDLLERYSKKCARLGVRRANLWFYAEIFWTALPLIKRALMSGGLITLGEWIRRHIS